MAKESNSKPIIRKNLYGSIQVVDSPLQVYDEAIANAPCRADGQFMPHARRRIVLGLLRAMRTDTFAKAAQAIYQGGAEIELPEFDFDADDEDYAKRILSEIRKRK